MLGRVHMIDRGVRYGEAHSARTFWSSDTRAIIINSELNNSPKWPQEAEFTLP